MERHGDVKMSTAQIASMVEMLKKEGEVEAMTKKIDALDAPIMPQVIFTLLRRSPELGSR